MSTDLEADALKSFEIAPDGRRIRFNAETGEGAAVSLSLPSECLTEMVMTLPRIAVEAMKRRYGDPSMRIVYPAGSWIIEQAVGAPDTFIVTLKTVDGFEVSFSFSPQQLSSMTNTLAAAGHAEIAKPIAVN